MNSVETPLYLRDEFRCPKGIRKMWEIITSKIVESFNLPNYINYETYMLTVFSYDLCIQSNKLYKYRVTLNEQITVKVIDVHSFTTPTKTFEYTGGVLLEYY